MVVNVRRADHDDLSGVARLLRAGSVAARVDETWTRMMATDDLHVYVAEEDGEIVGTTSMLVMPNLGYECHPSAFIEAMVVDERHRRRGVGRLLIEWALADAKAEGCHKVQLLSHKRHADDGAHDFYRSLGFDAEAEGFRIYLGS